MAAETDRSQTFDAGKLYLVKGETLTKLYDLVKRNRPKAGAGIAIDEKEDGTVIRTTGGSDDAALPARYWGVAVNGIYALAQFNSSAPVSDVPPGTSVANPD